MSERRELTLGTCREGWVIEDQVLLYQLGGEARKLVVANELFEFDPPLPARSAAFHRERALSGKDPKARS